LELLLLNIYRYKYLSKWVYNVVFYLSTWRIWKDMDEILFSSFFALVFEFHLLSKKFIKNEFDSTYLISILFILKGLLESHPAGILIQNRIIVRYRKIKNSRFYRFSLYMTRRRYFFFLPNFTKIRISSFILLIEASWSIIRNIEKGAGFRFSVTFDSLYN